LEESKKVTNEKKKKKKRARSVRKTGLAAADRRADRRSFVRSDRSTKEGRKKN